MNLYKDWSGKNSLNVKDGSFVSWLENTSSADAKIIHMWFPISNACLWQIDK